MAVRPLKKDEDIAPVSQPRRLREDEGFAPRGASTGDVTGPGEFAVGLGETALSLATGAVAEPISGLVGLGTSVYDLVTGGEDPIGTAAERIESVRERLTFTPRTQAGQNILGGVAQPFQALQDVSRGAGGRVLEGTGSPAAATVAQTAIEAVPMALGGRAGVSARKRARDIAEVERQAERTGVDLEAPGERQREQVVGAAERERGDVTERGEAMPDLQAAVQRARAETKARVDALFENARRTKAGLPVSELVEFAPLARRSLEDFDVDTMPIVQRRLNELDELSKLPSESAVKLDAIDKWRKRLNRNRPAKSDTAQNAALDVMRGQLDNYLQAKFNADMVSGDPTAIAKWREAREAYKRYRETFSDNKVIRQLAEQEATPETVRSWLFGTSSVGAKSEAGAVARRLKEIVGEDSPQFRALRQDALLDVMEPLLRETPDFQAFVRNYDRLAAKNPTLVKELFPESETALRDLRNMAKGVDARTPGSRLIDLNRTAAVALFGHGIAKGALRVGLARDALGLVRRAGGRSGKRQVMAEILGYDAGAPLVPMTPAVVGGTSQSVQHAERRERERGRDIRLSR